MLNKVISIPAVAGAISLSLLMPTASSAFDVDSDLGYIPKFNISQAEMNEICKDSERELSVDLDCEVDFINDADKEYTFRPAFEGDIPTRETARRFYEWNPIQGEGNGSKINAHIFHDEKEFGGQADKTYTGVVGQVSIVLVNENSWSDFLAAKANQTHSNPIHYYLTNSKDSLDPETYEILKGFSDARGKNHPGNVTIIGGTEAISENIEDELRKLRYSVDRIGGKDRVDTMVKTFPSKTYFQKDYNPTKLNLVRGYAAPGASESGSYADTINMKFDGGTLLTNTDSVHPTTKAALESGELGVFNGSPWASLYIYGGQKAVSKAVEDDIMTNGGISPYSGERYTFVKRWSRRISGPTRYHTAIESGLELADRKRKYVPISNEVIIIDGEAPDMFKVAYPIRANFSDHPMVLVNGDEIPSVTADYLKDFGDPAKILPGNEHRRAICYASETACAKAREIMGITQ